LLARIESLRLLAGERMGLGDVSNSVVPKPVLVSAGDGPLSITSRYFTPRRCHSSHAVTGAIGVATAFALPGTVASGTPKVAGKHPLVVLHPGGQIDVEVEIEGEGQAAEIKRAALVRTARKILQGEMTLPGYVFPPTALSSVQDYQVDAKAALPFPAKGIQIIVPTSAGGGNDTMARALARKLGPLLGCAVTVDNRAGANGGIASEYVAAARPDGHTLLFGYIATHGINPELQTLRYDPLTSFSPVGLVGRSPTLLVVNADLQVHSVLELTLLLQARPGYISYASAGEGTVPHVAAELFKLQTGVAMTGRVYPGAAPAIADIARGNPKVMFPSLFTAQPYLRSGRLRALAVAAATRLPAYPELSTLAEAGMAGFDLSQWYALFAPAKTPSPIVEQLNHVLNAVLQDPEIVAGFAAEGTQVGAGTALSLGDLLREEQSKWRSVVQQLGLRIEASGVD